MRMHDSSTTGGLPLSVRRLDHYTLICADAARVADFHTSALDFAFERIQSVNSGTVGPGEVDMLNQILRPPGDPDVVTVVTEGLNDGTIFRRYMNSHGPGIHHVAFEVDDVDAAFEAITEAGVQTAAGRVTTDMLSGLKQFFIAPSHAGFFVELIEQPRPVETETVEREPKDVADCESGDSRQRRRQQRPASFTNNNMAELAQSISHLLTRNDEGGDASAAEEKKYAEEGTEQNQDRANTAAQRSEEGTDDDVVSVSRAMSGVEVGRMSSVEIRVEDPIKSAEFLEEVLGFRFVRRIGADSICMGIPCGSDDGGANIILSGARSKEEERKATVAFECAGVRGVRRDDLLRSVYGIDGAGESDGSSPISRVRGAVVLPERYASYKILLTPPGEDLSNAFRVVRLNEDGSELRVDIRSSKETVLNFLAHPPNLAQWTGHKAIRYSQGRGSWVETRRKGEQDGSLVDFLLRVDRIGDSAVLFSWPERNVEVRFECTDGEPPLKGRCCTVKVALPTSTMSEGRLAEMRRILTLELDLLKAILEGNSPRCIPDRVRRRIEAHHPSTRGNAAKNVILPEDAARQFGFSGEILRAAHGDDDDGDGRHIDRHPLVEQMSSDFAMTIKSRPVAVLRPNGGVEDVRAAVRMASGLGLTLAARGSRISHSAGGQAQADGGLVLDLSTLSSVDFVDDTCTDSNGANDDYSAGPAVKVGAGTMWHEVIRRTLERGLMPPVINDYQYLSVGGTLSMGGVGFMSHRWGVQAGHVIEMEIVTGLGDVVTCSSQINDELFDCARAGLGQCGVATSVTVPLVPAPQKITNFKLFYEAERAAEFFGDVRLLVDDGRVDMIHAFLKPCTQQCLTSLVGSEELASSSSEFRSAVEAGESSDGLVFFLELGCYMQGDSAEGDDARRLNDIRTFLSSTLRARCVSGEIFSSESGFREHVERDPPVVETNKAHGHAVPHPSFATVVDEEHAGTLMDLHLGSDDRGDDASSEILIMPVRSNDDLRCGRRVPMFPMPRSGKSGDGSSLSFFVLFLGSVISSAERDADDVMRRIRAHHRRLYELSLSLGAKRYSYDTVTSEVRGEEAWSEHYEEETWRRLCAAKSRYDPYHVLCPGVKMWG